MSKISYRHLGFVVLSFSLLMGLKLLAQDVETMCRAKAKSAALDTYKGCVTEHKTAQIEELRQSYQEKLRDLKSEYDQELKRLGGKKSQTNNNRNSIKNSKRISKGESLEVTTERESDNSVMDIPEPIPLEQYN